MGGERSMLAAWHDDYTSMPCNKNSSSAISCLLLANLDCAAAYKFTMLTILVNSNNEFELSILEALLKTRLKPELCIQKKFYTPLLFKTPVGLWKETLLPTPTHLAYGNFLKSVFLLPSSFFNWQYPMLASSDVNFVITDIIL